MDPERVGTALVELARALLLPRFRALAHGDIEEKGPGDVVTIADREMEAALAVRLAAVLPGSRVVGEEACSTHPGLLAHLDRGWVWLVDPLDGTRNFAAGSEDFATMVGLLHDGLPVGGWIYRPMADELAVAERGSGAFVGGRRTRVASAAGAGTPGVVGRHVPVDLRAAFGNPDGGGPVAEGSGAAGLEYPALVAGHWRFLLYWRTHPWDHVPGTLFLEEAGGHAARLDGSAYRAAEARLGLLAAPDEDAWHAARARLSGPLPGGC